MRTIYHEVEIDMQDILAEATKAELMEECNDRSLTILEESAGGRGTNPQNLFERLCTQFDLPRAATTKQELITHINNQL